MEFNLLSFILDIFDASGGIGGYVSISIIGFALISFATKKKIKGEIKYFRYKWAHALIGSLIGAIPGCGATIIIASLYKNKKISFGGLLASFISTLGEGSFVLLGASNETANIVGNINGYFTITIFGLIVGFIFGFIYDIAGFKFHSKNDQKNIINDNYSQVKKDDHKPIFIEKLGINIILLISVLLAPGSIMGLWGGGIEILSNLTYWLSITFSLICIIYYCFYKFINTDKNCFCNENNLKSISYHAVMDVAMVVTYIFIGLFITNFIIDVIIGTEKFEILLTSSIYIIIFLSAIIGVIPGCGGMIAVAVAFITIPNFPMAALIAAGISTSGDGIFTMLAENKRDGVIVSGIGLLLALIIGYLALALGF